MRIAAFLVLLVFVGGCGGYYVLTVPDVVAPAGQEAVVVCRLLRNDFFFLALPVRDAAMRYTVAEGPERGAYTDRLGYAGTPIDVPGESYVYTLHVSHLDREGEEVTADAPLYAWDHQLPIVAVDFDGLPITGSPGIVAAREALARLAAEGHVLYLTRRSFSHPGRAHDLLRAAGYPDGPVLLWQRQQWHIVRERWNMPRVVIESRLVSQLPELRKALPRLEAGVCTSSLAAKAFASAGMRCVVVGKAKVGVPDVTRVGSWAQLAEGMR